MDTRKKIFNLISLIINVLIIGFTVYAVSVTLTMITACFFLSTIYSFKMMISGNCFFLHLITPLIAILACTVFEADEKMSIKEMLTGLKTLNERKTPCLITK